MAVAASGIPAAGKAIVAAAALLYAAFELRRLRHPRIKRCAWYADGQWRVRDAEGNDHHATLLDSSVRGGLVVLRFSVAGQGRVALVLLPDNCDPDIRRRLAVRLSHAASDVAT